MNSTRRSFVTGALALVAAPAIVRAGSLMPVKVTLQPWQSEMALWFDQAMMITREVVELSRNSNAFLKELDEQYAADRAFMEADSGNSWQWDKAKIGSTFRIRLPADYMVSDGPGLVTQQIASTVFAKRDDPFGLSQIPDSLALAAAAVAIVPTVLAKPVTRRFWAK